MSAREDMRGNIGLQNNNIFCMTVLGPYGLKNKLANSFNFMGRMRNLRAIEFTKEEASLEHQKFGLRHLLPQ
jgi:hypothetical protein